MLSRAKSLIVAVKAPLAEVKSTQEKVLEQNADYLSRGALKQLEDRNKRELTRASVRVSWKRWRARGRSCATCC